jgi:hypothetical protein
LINGRALEIRNHPFRTIFNQSGKNLTPAAAAKASLEKRKSSLKEIWKSAQSNIPSSRAILGISKSKQSISNAMVSIGTAELSQYSHQLEEVIASLKAQEADKFQDDIQQLEDIMIFLLSKIPDETKSLMVLRVTLPFHLDKFTVHPVSFI